MNTAYRCPNCQGRDLSARTWSELNTGENTDTDLVFCNDCQEEICPLEDDTQPAPAPVTWYDVTELQPNTGGGGHCFEMIDGREVLYSRPVLVVYENTWADRDRVRFIHAARLRLDTHNPYLCPDGCPDCDKARGVKFWFGSWVLSDSRGDELEGAGWRVTHWAELPALPAYGEPCEGRR